VLCCAVHVVSHAALGQDGIESLAPKIQPSVVAILTYGDGDVIKEEGRRKK